MSKKSTNLEPCNVHVLGQLVITIYHFNIFDRGIHPLYGTIEPYSGKEYN